MILIYKLLDVPSLTKSNSEKSQNWKDLIHSVIDENDNEDISEFIESQLDDLSDTLPLEKMATLEQ